MPISSKHHYIPEFFIKGFTDDDGMLWIYDKKADKIIKDKKFPSSYFFEKDINSISIAGKNIDLIEQAYSKLDNYFANRILKIRDDNVDSIENVDSAAIIDVFMMFQFWRRYPNNDEVNHIAENLLHYYQQLADFNIDGLKKNISISDLDKIQKSLLPFQIMKDSKIVYKLGDIGHFKILDFAEPFYFISDYSMIFNKIPLSNNDLFKQLKIFPISKNRIYVSLLNKEYTLNSKQSMSINILLIDQADKYVGSFSKKNLEYFVNMYREIKLIDSGFQNIKEQLFSEINSGY